MPPSQSVQLWGSNPRCMYVKQVFLQTELQLWDTEFCFCHLKKRYRHLALVVLELTA